MKNKKTICSIAVVITLVLSAGKVRTNREGLMIIGNAEGCYTTPYYCPAGKLTDGIGNTNNVSPVTRKDLNHIARDWERNILDAEYCINTYFRGRYMPDDTFSAMTSAAFNLGCYRLRTYYNTSKKRREETTIYKLAQAGHWRKMCRQLPSFANGGKYPGLIVRRNNEMVLCLKGLK